MKKDNIIRINFQNPDVQWLDRARNARRKGDVLSALQMYRTVLAKDPYDMEAGMAYAVLLWEIGCWESSLRECFRFLAAHPQEDQIYGLIYRNQLELGREDEACAAYERYVMHLLRHPEGGLLLEDETLIVPKPPARRRFRRLLARAENKLAAGKLEEASRLLAHAAHPAFPKHSMNRDLVQLHLMFQCGLVEDGLAIAAGLVEEDALNASQLIALMPLLGRYIGPEETGKLLLHAASIASTPPEVADTVQAALLHHQPRLAMSLLDRVLEATPYRLDAHYNKAMTFLHLRDTESARKVMNQCELLDPCCADANMMHRLILVLNYDEESSQLDRVIAGAPVYGSRRSASQSLILEHFQASAIYLNGEQLADMLSNWQEQGRQMDCLHRCSNEAQSRIVACGEWMEPRQAESFLRLCLLTGDLYPQPLRQALMLLHRLGVTGQVPMMQGGYLTMVETIAPKEHHRNHNLTDPVTES